MKKSGRLILIFALAVAGVISCKRPEQTLDRTSSNLMYAEIKQLLEAWTDSLNAASDSASVANAVSAFEEKLVKINFAYPPETDMNMTEGQQDTIFKLTSRFAQLKRKKENSVFERDTVVAIPDSLPKK